MTMTKWIAALAVVSLAAAPAAAEVSRTPAPVQEAESLSGGGTAWIIAGLIALAAILYFTTDDNDEPISP